MTLPWSLMNVIGRSGLCARSRAARFESGAFRSTRLACLIEQDRLTAIFSEPLASVAYCGFGFTFRASLLRLPLRFLVVPYRPLSPVIMSLAGRLIEEDAEFIEPLSPSVEFSTENLSYAIGPFLEALWRVLKQRL